MSNFTNYHDYDEDIDHGRVCPVCERPHHTEYGEPTHCHNCARLAEELNEMFYHSCVLRCTQCGHLQKVEPAKTAGYHTPSRRVHLCENCLRFFPFGVVTACFKPHYVNLRTNVEPW